MTDSPTTCIYRDPRGTMRCTECGNSEDLCVCVEVNRDAHTRLWSREGRVLRAIMQEIEDARTQFPEPTFLLAALQEEVGEVANALLEHHRGNKPPKEVLRECVQTAAMAVRIAIEGDPQFDYDSETLFGE